MAWERAELGIDGNCGFALLGENLQEGEAEFEEFEGDLKTSDGHHNAVFATFRAFSRLQRRIRKQRGIQISYFLGRSHPDFLG